MTRQQHITKYISKAMRGIEIAPWHSPIVPKREGYNCVTLDFFDTATLHQRAKDDPQVNDTLLERIEDVDIVGSAVDIKSLVEARGELGAFDYIISSHNFEHLPNPVKFLQGCSEVLKPDGMLSMAVPDKRGCFDYFKPHSTTADFIEAFFENRLPRAGEHSSIHWHGVRLPIDQDGVPYLTQPPVEPGSSFRYVFTPPDTGTFFFHTHCNTP